MRAPRPYERLVDEIADLVDRSTHRRPARVLDVGCVMAWARRAETG